MSFWGGPKRRVQGVLLGFVIGGLGRAFLLGVGQTWIFWAGALFITSFLIPIVNGSNQAIWQAKVAPDVQGRVFSARRVIAWAVIPLSRLTVIPLADKWLEPAMQEGGSLAHTFDWLVGTGPGAGIALIIVFAGFFSMLTGLIGYMCPTIRHIENILPDHELCSSTNTEQ
jgi:hypothetical protein